MKTVKIEIDTDIEGQMSDLGELVEKQFPINKSRDWFVIPIRGQLIINCKESKNTVVFGPDSKSK